MATYDYSFSVDFSNNITFEKFITEINTSSISENLVNIVREGDEVHINFDATLSAGDQITLNNLVSSHIPIDTDILENIINIDVRDKFDNEYYERIAMFVYKGSYTLGDIKRISFVGYKDSKLDDYKMRIYDLTNANILAEETFTNDEEQINEITSFSNMPATESIIEIQCKRSNNRKKNYYIDTLQVYV